MKKTITLFAVVALLASVSFAQGTARRGQTAKPVRTPAAAFKAQLKKQAAKAAGDTISSFPWNEGFENGTTGFTLVDSDNDGYNWVIRTASEDNYNVHGGDACITSASYDNDDEALTPDNWMILPVMQIPASATDLTLSWFDIGQDADYADEYYSVYITTAGHSVSDFTATTPVYSGYSTSVWTKRSVDLSSYAGQTIHIAFRHYNVTDMFVLNIDDIRIGSLEAPEVTLTGPTAVPTNVEATYVATSDATAFAWYVDGTPHVNTSNTLTTTFTTVGSHQVVVLASNSVGTTRDTLDVDVFSCDGISIPYAPDFSAGLGCWTSRSDSTEGSGWFASVEMFDDDPVGQVLSMSAQSYFGMFVEDFPHDNWLFSPSITMPATGNYEIAWKVRPYDEDFDGDHYGVYIIQGSTATLLYEESLTGMTDFTQRMAIIPSTVSGDFQVAFRHFNSVGGYVIILDDIQLRTLSAPALTLRGPAEAENGVSVTFVADCPNAESFSWTVDGGAVSENTNTLTTTFSTDGSHTVAVTATNTVGTASDSKTVEVYTCYAVTDFPYTMDFESGMRCWTMVSMDPANDDAFGISEDADDAYNGYGSFVFSSYNNASDYNQYLISPELDIPAAGSYKVSFYYTGDSESESFRIMASTGSNDLASFTEVADFPETAEEWTLVSATLPAGTKYVAIDYYGNYQYYLYVDDITISDNSGIGDVDSGKLSIYPNPASGMVVVSAEGVEGDAVVSIVDLNGRTVMQQNGSGRDFHFDVSALSRGAYFVRMTGENVNIVRKLVLK